MFVGKDRFGIFEESAHNFVFLACNGARVRASTLLINARVQTDRLTLTQIVADAIGVRIRELPFTPGRVKAAVGV